jgi:hypothetical protein
MYVCMYVCMLYMYVVYICFVYVCMNVCVSRDLAHSTHLLNHKVWGFGRTF